MVDVKGKPEDPAQIIVELKDTGEKAVITKDQPFKRVDGYTADLHYDLEKKRWTARRVGSQISFNGEDYTIVAINQNEVVLSAKVNGKKWTIKSNSNSSS
jgi:frataxin-like iron-binding protein CyaY